MIMLSAIRHMKSIKYTDDQKNKQQIRIHFSHHIYMRIDECHIAKLQNLCLFSSDDLGNHAISNFPGSSPVSCDTSNL